jgi:DNA-binding CsgD family transcriptional regulator
VRSAAEALACVAPGYFDRAGDVICRIAGARTEADVVLLLREATSSVGADVGMFCSLVQNAPAQLRFMLACDPRWYLECERCPTSWQAPWLVHAAHSSEPICGSELDARTAAQIQALERAKRFGFDSMFVVPSPSAGAATQLGVLLLGSRTPGFFESRSPAATRIIARSLAMELHAWRLTQARQELIQRAQLTATDIDLLRHERKGLGTKEIARHLCMSGPAIDSRFQRLNARLGVPSRKAAASLAATYGLV